jgi:hypothetical protein
MACLKNFTMLPYFGATVNDNMFTLQPESVGDAGYIYVVTHCRQDASFTMMPTQVDAKMYSPPGAGRPLYIEEFNLVLFATAEERAKAIERYGNCPKLIRGFASGAIPLINGNYVVTTCLNTDKTYFTLTGDNGIVELPKEKQETVAELMRKYELNRETFDTFDVFITNQIVRNGTGSNKDVTISSQIKKIERSRIKIGEPIIFNNSGFVVFDSKDSAEAFIKNYGTLGNYLIDKALETTHEIHNQEIEELNAKAKSDKRGIIETFGIMGGTSIASILAENLIKSSMEGEGSEETFKKAVKIAAIGAIGIGAVFGGYKLYRHYENKKKAAAKAANRR